MILAGDIGGTKTILGLYSRENGSSSPLAQQSFPSGDYQSLETIVDEFLSGKNRTVDKAVFGVAGPVSDGKAAITNLPWIIEENRLKTALHTPNVKLINDLEATAWSIPFLTAEDIFTLHRGERVLNGNIAVIGPGTGLGEAFLTMDAGRHLAHSCEGGHADLAPATPIEIELVRVLSSRYDHVSYERVCSGIGIPNIYRFLRDHQKLKEPSRLAEKIKNAADPVPIIVKAALDTKKTCSLCAATMDLFVNMLGAEAGNLALKIMATGGVYLAGGIPPRILPLLQSGGFMNRFSSKGRLAGVLRKFPVHVILSAQACISGAAYYALERYEHEDRRKKRQEHLTN